MLRDDQHNKGVDLVRILQRVPFFQDQNPEQLTMLASWFRENSYAADEMIFCEGDEAIRFWIVKSGQVKIVKYGKDCKEIVIEVIPPGETFGGASMLMSHQPATAQGLTEATTISITTEQVRQMLKQYPDIAIRVIEALGSRMLAVVRMRVISSERVERRIAHILLKMATKCGRMEGNGIVLTISMTRQDIADLADTTLESAIRTMSSLSKREIVKTRRGGYIMLRDLSALQTLAGQDAHDEVTFQPPPRT